MMKYRITPYIFLAIFLFLGYAFGATQVSAAKWGPRCSEAASDHKYCPSHPQDHSWYPPNYAKTCVDSVNLVGNVYVYGLIPQAGDISVSVHAKAKTLTCNYVQCLVREDTSKPMKIDHLKIGSNNPYHYLIDTIGCSGGTCNDDIVFDVVVEKTSAYRCSAPVVQVNIDKKNNVDVNVPNIYLSCVSLIPPTPTPTGCPSPAPVTNVRVTCPYCQP